jgi:hypothetical protein
MNAQHTPTPWTVMADGRHIVRNTKDGTTIVADCGEPSRHFVKEPEKGNAAFIVRACNSHEALVAALKAAMPALERSAENCAEHQSEVERLGPVCKCFSHRTVRAARAALAQAGEGA